MNQFVASEMVPTCTFYLDIDIDVMIERKRGMSIDRMEDSGLNFFKNVRDGYLNLEKKQNRIIKIDASKNVESIQSEIWKHLKIIYKGQIE